MTAPSDSILTGIFFGAFIAMTAGEIFWLTSRRHVPAKKALTVVLLPNFATITLGFLVTFVLFALLLASTAGDDSRNMGIWIMLIIAFAFPFMLMAAIRRLLIGGLRIETVANPLSYALVSTAVFFAVVLGLPGIFLAFR